MKIVIGTKNKHKFQEIADFLQVPGIEFIPLPPDIEEAPEDFNTLEDNAYQKAKFYYDKLKLPVISDDTGLFVEHLGGEPGVRSARYAGKNASYSKNRKKLLQKLQGVKNRNAYFKTVVCYYDGNKTKFFEGITKGVITTQELGENGFGYDPIFIPEGFRKTYAQMSFKEKQKISHRTKALDKIKHYFSMLML